MKEQTYHTARLLECPFCGQDNALIEVLDNAFDHMVHCNTPYCHGNLSKCYPNSESAIKAWNTRLERNNDRIH